ncbi:glutathione peroxidase [Candidatus Pelagibacter sp.]|nr:glutathione peroxidase [Candidatus Pelagibacter sp.]
MYNKNYLIILFITLMFSFFEKADAKYEKVFFNHKIKNINNEVINLNQYKGKTILLVNVTSKCGFTNQYTGLQALYEKYKNKGFFVIGVPSNQFGGQEPGSNTEIKDFCETNFNITFPMMDKINVKGNDAHEIYKWAKKNFGTSTVPMWNFHKILINKAGKIQKTFGSFTKPLSSKITLELEKIL